MVSFLLSDLVFAEDPAAPPAPAPVPVVVVPAEGAAPSGARIHFESTKPNLAVSVIEGRGTGTAYGAGGSATIQTTYYRSLCVAPCIVETTAGLHEYFGTGGGNVAVARTLDIRSGDNKVVIEPGSAALRTVGLYGAYLGLTSVIVGGTLVVVDSDGELLGKGPTYGLLAGGAVAFGGGLALSISNKGRWSVTHP
jgi:hypothetical protein